MTELLLIIMPAYVGFASARQATAIESACFICRSFFRNILVILLCGAAKGTSFFGLPDVAVDREFSLSFVISSGFRVGVESVENTLPRLASENGLEPIHVIRKSFAESNTRD